MALAKGANHLASKKLIVTVGLGRRPFLPTPLPGPSPEGFSLQPRTEPEESQATLEIDPTAHHPVPARRARQRTPGRRRHQGREVRETHLPCEVVASAVRQHGGARHSEAKLRGVAAL